jgi:hypothetical protein
MLGEAQEIHETYQESRHGAETKIVYLSITSLEHAWSIDLHCVFM